jgi:dihydroorotase
MVGLETSLAACFTALVLPGHLTVPQLLAKMSLVPSQLLGLPLSTQVGDPADLMAFDPQETWTVDPAQFRSKGRSTVFSGTTLTGRVCLTLLEGRITYQR